MARYFIELAYQGTQYCGWQRQPNAVSVQVTIEQALEVLLRQPTPITGCGRTDTGVHAAYYTAHFESDNPRVESPDFIYHINCVLPHDIAIHKIYPKELHARFDARYREYKYYIQRHKSPFNTLNSWLITVPLNEDMMQEAASKLLFYEDFASFSRTGSNNKSTICKIYRADWEFSDNLYTFTIGANRFLRGMVRATVGTLVDVGRDKITVDRFCEIIQTLDRRVASAAAPSQGLFLTDVQYEIPKIYTI